MKKVKLFSILFVCFFALVLVSCEDTSSPSIPGGGGGNDGGGANEPNVTSVSVSPATVTVERGGSHNFTATVLGTNNPSQNVEWTIDMWGLSAGTTINTSGGLTVSPYETSRTITVRARSRNDNPWWSVDGTASVTVPAPPGTPEPTVSSVTVSPATVTVARGGSHNFTATVLGTNNPPQAVTWEIQGQGTSTWNGSTINSSGGLTISSTETQATLTLIARTVDQAPWWFNVQGTATVTIDIPPNPTVTSVTVSPATATLARGGTQNFTANVFGTNNPPQAVTWELHNGSWWSTFTWDGSTINSSGGLTVSATETIETIIVRAISEGGGQWPLWWEYGEATVIVSNP